VIPIANPELGEPETERVSAVIESGMLADGDEVREFEQEFAEFCGVKRGVATSNGTTALHAALEALEIGDGDRVLTTPFFVHRDGERDQTHRCGAGVRRYRSSYVQPRSGRRP